MVVGVVPEAIEAVAGGATVAAGTELGVHAACFKGRIFGAHVGGGGVDQSSAGENANDGRGKGRVCAPQGRRNLAGAAAPEVGGGSAHGALRLRVEAAVTDDGVDLVVRPHLGDVSAGHAPNDPGSARIDVDRRHASIGEVDDVRSTRPVKAVRRSAEAYTIVISTDAE